MALYNGLDAGIANPNSKAMMDVYYSFCALNCFDENCMEYISHNSETETAVNSGVSELWD